MLTYDTENKTFIKYNHLHDNESVSILPIVGGSVTLALDNDSDVCYTYDNDGNLIYKSENGVLTSYLWDTLDRLTDVYYIDNESVIYHTQYLYNGDGQRIYTITDGSLTGCLYDGDQVIAEFDNDGRVASQFIHGSGLGADVGSLLYKETLDDTSYYYYNYRGDVIDVIDAESDLKISYRYDAFGNIISKVGTGENDLLFSSRK